MNIYEYLENTEHHQLNASQNVNILSLLSLLPNLGCLFIKISRIYETVTKNLRFDVIKCKETSKLKTEYIFLLKKGLFGPKFIEQFSIK